MLKYVIWLTAELGLFDLERLLEQGFRGGVLVALLFALVEAEYAEPEGGAPLPAAFSLAAQFPRRVLLRPEGDTAGPSLAEAGLSSPQESLVIELPHD